MRITNHLQKRLAVPLLSVALAVAAGAATAAEVYSSGFETPVGAEWSSANRDITPVGARTFLGQFGKETVTLTLSDLPPHSYVEIEFDLFIIRSWDGNGTYCCGPDIWDLSVLGGATLLHTTFAYNDGYAFLPAERQAFPDSHPGGNHLARTGAVENNSLGFTYQGSQGLVPADAVYHLNLRAPHDSDGVVFAFSGTGAGLQEVANESWGLDNVTVRAIAAQVTASRRAQWTVEAGGNGHSYEAVMAPGGIAWNDASAVAASRGGYLASVTSSGENAFIFSLVSGEADYWYRVGTGNWWGPWLGGVQPSGSPEPSGGWRWTTGEPFIYTNWAPEQPNNSGGNENRIQLGGGTTRASTWNDIESANSQYVRSFVIEYDSNPDTVVSIRVSQVEVCWTTRSNLVYQVQYSSELTPNLWTDLGAPIQGSGSTNCVCDPVLPGEPRKFYRVVTLP